MEMDYSLSSASTMLLMELSGAWTLIRRNPAASSKSLNCFGLRSLPLIRIMLMSCKAFILGGLRSGITTSHIKSLDLCPRMAGARFLRILRHSESGQSCCEYRQSIRSKPCPKQS